MLRHILIAVFSCLLVFLCYLYVSYTYVPQSTFSVQQMHNRLKNRAIFQTAHFLARWELFSDTYNEVLVQYQQEQELIKNNKPGAILPGHTADIGSSEDESSNAEDLPSIDPSFVEQDGTLIRTSYFEFTIPTEWVGKVSLTPSKSASTFHLHYTEGLTEEAKEFGYYQTIFDIILFTDLVDLDKAYSMHERFDILGVADGVTYVLTQRTDSALEFYSPGHWEEIKYMCSGAEFDSIIDSFVLY